MDMNDIFNTGLNSLLNPTKTANELVKKKIGMGDGALAVLLGSLVLAVVVALAIVVAATWFGMLTSLMPMMGWTSWMGTGLGMLAAIGVLIGIPIGMLVAWLVISVIVWVIASLMGGKGDFGKFATTLAFPFAALVAVSWIQPINIFAGIYGVYLLYAFLQPTMKMDEKKAALTVLVLFALGSLCSLVFGVASLWAMPRW
jgi:hypothetical protein